MESALAAAVVAEAAAATTGETAAQVGEAAADEEEGEAAAAAKGKRTALRGLGGIPQPASSVGFGSGTSSPRRARPLWGRPRLPRLLPRSARVLPGVARRREAPKSCRAGGGGEHRAWPGLQGAGGGGPNGPVLELSAGESRGGGALPPARPQACDLEAGGREPDDFEGGGNPVWIKLTLGARELRENQGSYVCVG